MGGGSWLGIEEVVCCRVWSGVGEHMGERRRMGIIGLNRVWGGRNRWIILRGE